MMSSSKARVSLPVSSAQCEGKYVTSHTHSSPGTKHGMVVGVTEKGGVAFSVTDTGIFPGVRSRGHLVTVRPDWKF